MNINEAPILEQIDNKWDILFTWLMWKMSKYDKVVISIKDMEEFRLVQDAEHLVLFTHGHKDCIEFQLMSQERAEAVIRFSQEQGLDKGTG
jgi:hypothetical protein